MTDWNSEIMRKWDDARAYIANGGTSSWPRDWFESEIDARDDRIKQLEAENARLTYALMEERLLHSNGQERDNDERRQDTGE